MIDNGIQCCKCQTKTWINRIVLGFMLFVIHIVLWHFLFSDAIDFCRYLKPLNWFSGGWVCSFEIYLHTSALCVLVPLLWILFDRIIIRCDYESHFDVIFPPEWSSTKPHDISKSKFLSKRNLREEKSILIDMVVCTMYNVQYTKSTSDRNKWNGTFRSDNLCHFKSCTTHYTLYIQVITLISFLLSKKFSLSICSVDCSMFSEKARNDLKNKPFI